MVGHIQARPGEAHHLPPLPHKYTLAGELPCAKRLDPTGWKPVRGRPGFYHRVGAMKGTFLFNASTGFVGYQNPHIDRLFVKVYEEGFFSDTVPCKTADSGEEFSIWAVFSPTGNTCLNALRRFAEESGCDRVDLIFPDWATGAYARKPECGSLSPVSINVALAESGFSAIWTLPSLNIWKPPFFYYDHELLGEVRITGIKPGDTMPEPGFGDRIDTNGLGGVSK